MRNPRWYQTEQFDCVRDAFRAGKKGVIVEAPTGTGKAVSIALISKMVQEKGGRVLILVNRDILVTQLLAELKSVGVWAEREQADERASLTVGVVVASIQSLNARWLKKWPQDHFRLVILDEMHSSGAKTVKSVLDHFGKSYHCGFTATPERHDRKGLWKGYTDIVFSMTLKEAIDDGWLCGFDFIDLDCPVTLDEKLARQATFSETDEVFDSAKYLPKLADCAIEHSAGRKGLFFLPNCRVSNEFARMLSARGLNARHIDSSYMPPKETEEALDWFNTQPEAILCNAQLLTTGYNVPSIDTIGMFRPVASTPIYKQMLGRGTRTVANVDELATAAERVAAIAASTKPNCRVLQVFWENTGHDLAAPSCLITDDEDERKALNEARKAGSRTDFEKMEEQLKAKRMENQAEEMRKFAEKVANSQAKKRRAGIYIEDILRRKNPAHKPASEKFVKHIRSLGVDLPPGEYTSYQMFRIKDRLDKSLTS